MTRYARHRSPLAKSRPGYQPAPNTLTADQQTVAMAAPMKAGPASTEALKSYSVSVRGCRHGVTAVSAEEARQIARAEHRKECR